MPILAVMTASGLLFILFSLGQWLSTSPASLSDMIYQSQWYRYSLKPRIFVQFLIMRSQRKYSLSAFGAMALNLSNYVSVSQSISIICHPLIQFICSCLKRSIQHTWFCADSAKWDQRCGLHRTIFKYE